MTKLTAGFILLAVLLVACTSKPTIDADTRAAMTPAHTLYEIQATYNAALAGALVYAEQDRCTELVVVACHDAGVVAALAALDKRIVQAFKVARLATPGADQATAAATLRKLLAEFQSELLAGRVTP